MVQIGHLYCYLTTFHLRNFALTWYYKIFKLKCNYANLNVKVRRFCDLELMGVISDNETLSKKLSHKWRHFGSPPITIWGHQIYIELVIKQVLFAGLMTYFIVQNRSLQVVSPKWVISGLKFKMGHSRSFYRPKRSWNWSFNDSNLKHWYWPKSRQVAFNTELKRTNDIIE